MLRHDPRGGNPAPRTTADACGLPAGPAADPPGQRPAERPAHGRRRPLTSEEISPLDAAALDALWNGLLRESSTYALRASLLAHHPVSVRVAHVLISRVSTPDRGDAVSTGLSARDPAVPVVVPQGQGVHIRGRGGGCRSSWSC